MARRGSATIAFSGCLLLAALWHLRDMTGFVGSTAARAGRRPSVQANAVDKAMKERIASVAKTGKLTEAMRLVAAAKVRRAQAGVEKARPFSDELSSMIKGLVKKLKGSGLESELPMLRVPEKVSNVGIVMITADRGLCGGYNSYVMKKTAARVADLNKEGIVPKMIVVGKKGLGGLKTKLADVKLNYTGTFIRMPDTITSAAVAEVGDELRNLFLSGEVDKVEVIYAKFINLLANEPQVRTVLPLSPTGIEDPDDETFALTSEDGKLSVKKEKVKKVDAKTIEPDVIFDQPPEVILNSMLPLYLNSQLLSMLFDAQASELGSRMTAMKAATDNAKDLGERLTLIYNKKRQFAITQELCEITAGCLCLEAKGSRSGVALGEVDNEDTVGVDFMTELEGGAIPDSPISIDMDPAYSDITRFTGETLE
jgi:F-type H+-transporting ATPase subunit gamma